MLRTNNAKKFFEEYSTPLAVGMSDNAGYWAGYFLNKCKIDFVCYVDKNAKGDNSFCNGKPVYSFEKFAEYVSQYPMGGGGEPKTFRLFIPSKMLDTITEDITAIEAKCNITFVVLNAFYVISKGRLSYNVNKLFGYFRSKLLTTDLPSILANECAAGRIYEQLGIGYISPTINTNIKYEDFIKLCRNPRKYLVPITSEMYWTHWFGYETDKERAYIPAAKIEDIEVAFAHIANPTAARDRWNFLVEHVNFNRLIFVLVNSDGAIPYKVLKDFAELEGEKLLFYYGTAMYNVPGVKSVPFANRAKFVAGGAAIENYFDLVGWINREYL